ncbi:MAG TPA: vanadium-dependent haloperoxidase, partial [Puia sp.]|nr:vanadium-dependent haloperoxidase [Puia sp.]
ASVNTSLAEFNRSFFTPVNSNAADLAAIDSLEKAINSTFAGISQDLLDRSTGFGKSVADVIFSWSQTDGYNTNNALPYSFPVGPGLWIPTPTAFAKASGPFWGNDRPIIAGSGDNAQPGPPMAYSEDPKSSFYQMVKDLYTASKSLTTDQQNWALFWRDSPGVTSPGHWMSIVQQLIRQTHGQLDKAAMTYALVGICLNDAVISVFKTKYVYNLVRPVTYIRKVFGDTTWLSFIPTPAHPEYSSAHAVISASASEALVALYGNIGPLSDHTYDYLGFPARTFKSLSDIAVDAGNSRFYGGIHYQPSIDVGLVQGRTVGGNILKSLGK